MVMLAIYFRNNYAYVSDSWGEMRVGRGHLYNLRGLHYCYIKLSGVGDDQVMWNFCIT